MDPNTTTPFNNQMVWYSLSNALNAIQQIKREHPELKQLESMMVHFISDKVIPLRLTNAEDTSYFLRYLNYFLQLSLHVGADNFDRVFQIQDPNQEPILLKSRRLYLMQLQVMKWMLLAHKEVLRATNELQSEDRVKYQGILDLYRESGENVQKRSDMLHSILNLSEIELSLCQR